MNRGDEAEIPSIPAESEEEGEKEPEEWFIAQRVAGEGVPAGALERAFATAGLRPDVVASV